MHRKTTLSVAHVTVLVFACVLYRFCANDISKPIILPRVGSVGEGGCMSRCYTNGDETSVLRHVLFVSDVCLELVDVKYFEHFG